jgi:hypothetical protein
MFGPDATGSSAHSAPERNARATSAATERERAKRLWTRQSLIRFLLVTHLQVCRIPVQNRFKRCRGAVRGFELHGDLVDVRGFEPLTSSLRTRRSPN